MASRIVTLLFSTRLSNNSALHSACMKGTSLVLLLAVIIGCGGSVRQSQPQAQQPVLVSATFYGDSLTQFWQLDQFFPGKLYTNEGKFGFTAVTLSDDFSTFVPPTHPDIVMVLAGTNDVLQNDNANHIVTTLAGMFDKPRANGIPFVVICTLPPMAGDAGLAHNAVIVDVNAQLRNYAAQHMLPLADYYSVLADPVTGELEPQFSVDNVHLTQAAYDAMSPVAAKTIAGIRMAQQ